MQQINTHIIKISYEAEKDKILIKPVAIKTTKYTKMSRHKKHLIGVVLKFVINELQDLF